MIVLNVVFDMIEVVLKSLAVAQAIEQVVIILKNTRYKCFRQIVILLRELSHWKRAANELPLFPFASPPAHPVYSLRGRTITNTERCVLFLRTCVTMSVCESTVTILHHTIVQ